MRIRLLTNQDLDAVPFVDAEPPCDPRPYLPEATWHVAPLKKSTAVEQVTALAGNGFDLFFNLCDGAADDETTPGIEVVLTLEKLGVPFTGAMSSFYEPSREQMKQACRAAGIATPAYLVAHTLADVERASANLRFPLFVKHWSSYSSIGLSRASRVRTPEELHHEARKVMSRFRAALIEEYVEGLECTVLVAESPSDPTRPTTYVPIQYGFPDGESFKHEALKCIDWQDLKSFPVEDPVLAVRLRDEAAKFFVALGGTGFGRCDVRVDHDGTPFWLEINPQCGVYGPEDFGCAADLILLNDPGGHEGFTRQIVAAAMARHAGRRGAAARRPGGMPE
jgi:D-alanine-D-alanine ligase